MKVYIIFALLAVSVYSGRHEDIIAGSLEPTEQDYVSLYQSFQEDYKYKDHFIYQKYPEVDRENLFRENIDKFRQHNADPASLWKMGINKYADMTNAEFNEMVGIKERQDGRLTAPQEACSATAELTLKNPKEVEGTANYLPTDWRQLGVVSPVKNQGHCGSCWAFSTVAALEAHWTISTRQLPPPTLSEQQLVDCAQDFDNHGCEGGLPSHAFEYIKYNGGIMSNTSYPYMHMDTGSCRYDATMSEAYVPGGSINITAYNEDELIHAVAFSGPVSVAYQVAGDFKHYTEGVYDGVADKCNNTAEYVNHAVLAVGFNTDSNMTDYWIIKNSWGTDWGLEGYFLMKRGQNTCGIAACASYPNMKNSGLY